MGADLLAAAESLRWSRPDLMVELAGHVLAQAEAAGERDRWLTAAGLLVAGGSATGDGRVAAVRVLGALGRWPGDPLAAVAAGRLRVELAALAAGAGEGRVAHALVEPVLAGGAAGALRADATCVAARIGAPAGRTAAFVEADRAWQEHGGEATETALGRASIALLTAATARHGGRPEDAIAAATAGIDHLQASGSSARHLGAALAAEAVAAEIDAGRAGPARDRAQRAADDLAEAAAPSRQLARLRLTIASALAGVRGGDVTVEELETAAREAAASDAPELESICQQALGAIHEKAGRLDAALAAIRLGVEAQQRDRAREAEFLAAVEHALARAGSGADGSARTPVDQADEELSGGAGALANGRSGSMSVASADGAGSAPGAVTAIAGVPSPDDPNPEALSAGDPSAGDAPRAVAVPGPAAVSGGEPAARPAARTNEGAQTSDVDDVGDGISWLAGSVWGTASGASPIGALLAQQSREVDGSGVAAGDVEPGAAPTPWSTGQWTATAPRTGVRPSDRRSSPAAGVSGRHGSAARHGGGSAAPTGRPRRHRAADDAGTGPDVAAVESAVGTSVDDAGTATAAGRAPAEAADAVAAVETAVAGRISPGGPGGRAGRRHAWPDAETAAQPWAWAAAGTTGWPGVEPDALRSGTHGRRRAPAAEPARVGRTAARSRRAAGGDEDRGAGPSELVASAPAAPAGEVPAATAGSAGSAYEARSVGSVESAHEARSTGSGGSSREPRSAGSGDRSGSGRHGASARAPRPAGAAVDAPGDPESRASTGDGAGQESTPRPRATAGHESVAGLESAVLGGSGSGARSAGGQAAVPGPGVVGGAMPAAGAGSDAGSAALIGSEAGTGRGPAGGVGTAAEPGALAGLDPAAGAGSDAGSAALAGSEAGAGHGSGDGADRVARPWGLASHDPVAGAGRLTEPEAAGRGTVGGRGAIAGRGGPADLAGSETAGLGEETATTGEGTATTGRRAGRRASDAPAQGAKPAGSRRAEDRITAFPFSGGWAAGLGAWGGLPQAFDLARAMGAGRSRQAAEADPAGAVQSEETAQAAPDGASTPDQTWAPGRPLAELVERVTAAPPRRLDPLNDPIDAVLAAADDTDDLEGAAGTPARTAAGPPAAADELASTADPLVAADEPAGPSRAAGTGGAVPAPHRLLVEPATDAAAAQDPLGPVPGPEVTSAAVTRPAVTNAAARSEMGGAADGTVGRSEPTVVGCTVVLDLARDSRRFAGRRAGAVIAEVAELVRGHVPDRARIRFDESDALAIVLPDWSGPDAAQWMYRTLPGLLAGFVAAEDLPGVGLRATVHDTDGPVGAQLLQRIDAPRSRAATGSPGARALSPIPAGHEAFDRMPADLDGMSTDRDGAAGTATGGSGSDGPGSDGPGSDGLGSDGLGSDGLGSDGLEPRGRHGGGDRASDFRLFDHVVPGTGGRRRAAADREAADRQARDREAADRQAADRQARDREAGDRETGDRETGDRQVADRETGDREAADRQAGDRQASARQTGDRQSGHRETAGRRAADRVAVGRETAGRDAAELQAAGQESAERRVAEREAPGHQSARPQGTERGAVGPAGQDDPEDAGAGEDGAPRVGGRRAGDPAPADPHRHEAEGAAAPVETEGLGLADLLAGALAAYRGI